MKVNPFKFLDSYIKEDKNIFFGREHETEELYQKVFESKILLVYGVTGTGKTSLINCGLANKFNDSDWLPIYIRRNQDIIQSIIDQLSEFSYDKTKANNDKESILKLIQFVYLDNFKPIYLLFDQFEELFIFGNKDERKAFIELIDAINQSDIQCKCLFILREEFLANITEFEKTIPEFFQNRIRIEKMSPLKAIETIKGPCQAVGIEIKDEVAEDILRKVSKDESNIELTYLQVLLDKVYQLATKESKDGISITHEIVNKIGDVEDVLGDFLEQQIKTFDNSDDILHILKSFVSVHGTKKQVSPEEINDHLKTFGQEIDQERLLIILQDLVSKRILKEKDDHGRYELVHDALAAKIFEKFTVVEKELLDVRKYVENAFYNYDNRGILLNKQDFEYLEPYKNKLILPKNLNDFVLHCRKKLDSQKKSFARITRISALILILIVAALGRDIMGRMKRADLESQIGTILLFADANPIKGINMTIKMWEEYPTSNVLNYIILNNFLNLVSNKVDTSNLIYPLQKTLGPIILESDIEEAKISNSGNFIYGWTINQKGFVLNIQTNKPYYYNIRGQAEDIQFSERDSSVAVIYKDNRGEVYDLSGNVRYKFNTTLNEVMNKRLVQFFAKGDNHLLVANNRSAIIYDKKGEVLYELNGHTERINAVDISPDNRFIATASNDKNILLWNLNKNTEQISIYDTLSGHYDHVWSCEFNKTSKYVLTASADSMIKIWRLDGSQVNPPLDFARNLYSGNRFKFNNREEDNDRLNPDVTTYYRKMCNASFTNDEREIIATGYNEHSGLKKSYVYNQVLFYHRSSNFKTKWIWDYLDFTRQEPDYQLPEKYHKIVVSPNCDIALAVTQIGVIKLIAAGGIKIFSVQGNHPIFSNNGQTIFWIERNEIHSLPISPQIIKELILKFDLDKDQDISDGNIVVI